MPFFNLHRQNGDDDLTSLENIHGDNSSQSRRSSRSSNESGGSSSRRGGYRHRNMHPVVNVIKIFFFLNLPNFRALMLTNYTSIKY